MIVEALLLVLVGLAPSLVV